MIITSEWEHELKKEFITNGPISKVLGKYKKYKMIEDFPKDFKGSNSFLQKLSFLTFDVEIFRVSIRRKTEIY